jgi:lyso-ornithine lipid O-acyltransferase
MGKFRITYKLLLILLATITLPPVSRIFLPISKKLQEGIFVAYCRLVLKIIRLKVITKFEVDDIPRGALVISNHQSYLDVPIIGAITGVRFTPKSDVRKWPAIGFITSLTNPLFLERNPRKARAQVNQLQKAFENGDRISLFPEGTTNDGYRILPFKSSLIASVVSKDSTIKIAPISIVYTKIEGKPSHTNRDLVTWYGDMEFIPHLLKYLSLKSSEAEIIIHQPLVSTETESRKILAKKAENIIKAGVNDILKSSGQPLLIDNN